MSNLIAEAEKPLIIELLNENELWGYEIIRKLEEELGHRVPWKHGCLYPLLKSLEREGKVRGRWTKISDTRYRRFYKARQSKLKWYRRLFSI